MPVRDCWHYLQRTLIPLLENIRHDGNAELIVVDNGSTDGTYERLISYQTGGMICQLRSATISAVRNYGAAHAQGQILCFVDADCLVDSSYLRAVREAFDSVDAAAIGCQYDLPRSPHWIEKTWHAIHVDQAERYVEWVPGGNFAVTAEAFHRAGGFKTTLVTGEDCELCQRMRSYGYRIFQVPSVAVVHLGNPRSLRSFFRRDVWYALGMFGTVNRYSLDKPTAMMLFHLLFTGAALGTLFFGWMDPLLAMTLIVLSQLAVPTATVVYRLFRKVKFGENSLRDTRLFGRGVFLYWVYYWARIQALVIVLSGRSRMYRK